MNIALIIFPFHPSHGCILQSFAIYSTLKELGHSVTIINRKSLPASNKVAFIRGLYNLRNRMAGTYKGPIFYKGNSPKSLMKNLQPFINSSFGDSVVTVYSKEQAFNYVKTHAFDAFVIGSDQVWRPKYVPDIYHYYLDFLPEDCKSKRIAFCPSFGTDEWEYNNEQTYRCSELISRFNAVSVREDSGVKLCNRWFNKDAEHLLDPTILLTAGDYANAIHYKQSDKHKDVVSYYFLDNSEEKITILHKISKSLGFQERKINTETENRNAPLRSRIAPSMQTWIGGFANSRFVVADSFHATMFAILFNTPFITVANKERGLSRFESVLNTFGLKNRLVCRVEDVTEELVSSSIDWDAVNERLVRERERSLGFLKRVLS